MKNFKTKFVSVATTAVMLASAVIPASASAATATYKFTNSGNSYGITTTCSGFSSYVTANAKIVNNGVSVSSSSRGYKASSTSVTKTCTSGTVTRTGWYST